MTTPVFLTIDTELMWRHHADGLPRHAAVSRSFQPAGVGVAHQLSLLAAHRLKAIFFVDPMPALVYGLAPFVRIVDMILGAGQEVQLHLHPNWTGASLDDRSAHARFELNAYSAEEQRALIAGARDLLVAAGAPVPVAFRAGSYAANDDTLAALTALGITYDSSHNGAHGPWPSAIGLPARAIAPVARNGVIEVPVTLIDGVDGLRNVQLCALSSGEMRDALDYAAHAEHAAVTIVSHGFELANREGTRVNAVHLRRFEALCRMLEARADVLPTTHFGDRPALALGRDDAPLAMGMLQTRWRQAEQLWSNLVEERAA